MEIIEQLDAEKKAVEKKQSAFDEKYDLSQSLLAKRNDQLKDFEAALLAAKQQKESIRVDLESKCKEIADMKEGVVTAQAQIKQKELRWLPSCLSWRQPKKMHLFQRKKHKRAEKESKELQVHFEKEFEKCKKLLSESSAETNKIKAEKRKLVEQMTKLRTKRKRGDRRARKDVEDESIACAEIECYHRYSDERAGTIQKSH